MQMLHWYKTFENTTSASLHLFPEENGTTGSYVQEISYSLLSTPSPTSWEGKVARFCQRIRDVKVLVREDLQELLEPLDTLGNAQALSLEQVTQLEAAIASYKQAHLDLEHALDCLLLPFSDSL